MSLDLLPRQGAHHLLAIDTNDAIRRSWHGCANAHRNEPELAAPTALDMLARLVRGRQAPYVVFTGEGFGSVRETIYDKYKGNRPPKPDGLLLCEAQVEQALLRADTPIQKFAGLEADDVLHAAVLLGRANAMPVVVATRDKDLHSVVNREFGVFVLAGDKIFDDDAVLEKWGVPPSRMTELLALAGDDTDGVPHVKGWGPAAAKKMLATVTLDMLLAPDGFWYVPDRYRAAFRDNRDMIRMAYELVKLRGEQCFDRLDLETMAVDPLRLARDLSESANELRSESWPTF